jgi:hypothetical protein
MRTHILTRLGRATVAATATYTLFEDNALAFTSVGLTETISVIHVLIKTFSHFDNLLMLYTIFPVAIPLYIDMLTVSDNKKEYIILFSSLFIYFLYTLTTQ